MGFEIKQGESLRGFTTYVPGEYSIVFVHDEADADAVGLGRSSLDGALEIGTLTLSVRTSDGRIAFPEGYHPRAGWKEGKVSIPTVLPGVLFWAPKEQLIPGGALVIADERGVDTIFEPSTEWVVLRLADEEVIPDSGLDAVEVCEGVIAGLDGSRLVALWMLLHDFG